ncbi:MAG: outer envelope protein [Betaproteobacteria bacterium]
MQRKTSILAMALLAACVSANAADWSDNSIGYRYGTQFAEPFNNQDIAKHIVSFTHVSGYKYGTNFFTADYLLSDKKDPVGPGSNNGAQEIYAVYRHTLDLGKVSGKDLKFGPIRGFGFTTGFDLNTKDDAGYNSRKRMLVVGPTVMLDVPGFLNVSLLQLWESNAPHVKHGPSVSRYEYDPHPMLNLTWGIPIASTRLTFSGYANFIASKGKDEFGAETKAETNIDMALMYDASSHVGLAKKNAFQVGIGYQYWKNKFGNDHKGPAGQGAFAKTPMLRAEYHF